MAFEESELSNFQGEPIALYEFSVGTLSWYYSSGVEDQIIGGKKFIGTAASDGGVTQSGDAQNDDLVVTLPRNVDFARLFVGTTPAQEIWVTVRRMHEGETDAPVHWMGTVGSGKDAGSGKLEVTCNMLTASFNRNGLRLAWTRQCPHALYDRNCRVNKTIYAITLQIQTLTGNSIGSSDIGSLPSRHLSNGFFEWEIEPGLMDRRPIENHNGSSFTVLGLTDGLKVGDWITVYPGCNRTTAQCVAKFNNLSNYGGIPHLPGKSPFSGDPVF